jgi:hypothetical protein
MQISKYAQGTNSLYYLQELLSEEREMFGIIQSVNDLLHYDQQYTSYYHCLISMVAYDVNEPHSEPIARKTMELITHLLKTACLPLSVMKVIVPSIFTQVYT